MSGPALTPAFGSVAAEPKAKKQRAKAPAPFSIRFTEAERERLKRDAGKLSLSAHIRLCVFGEDGCPPKRRTRRRQQPSLDREALGRSLGQLGQSRLASNLNQIARAANTGALDVSPDLTAELNAACEAVMEMRDALLAALDVREP